MEYIKKYYNLVALVLLSIIAIIPFFHSGFFPFHDDLQVQRVFEMGKVLQTGVFPVRWVPDLGYGLGYPLFNFYGPLPYYFGAIFNILGHTALLSTKIMIASGVITSGIAMYLFAKEIWGENGGLVSGLLYVLAPYHALDIYVRGDIGEVWAYAFIPLVFFGIYKLYKYNKLRHLFIGSLGYFGVITSHNLSALMISPFIFLFSGILFFITLKHKKNYYLLALPIFGILLSSFYFLPAILEMGFTNVLSQVGGAADFRNHFVCFNQLWNSPWGFGGTAPGCIDGISFRLGKIHILLSAISFFLALVLYKKDKISSLIALIFSLFLGLSLFLTLDYSKFIWNSISLMSFLQYPWRFLLIASFFSSVLGGFFVSIIKIVFDNKKYNKYFEAVLVISVIILSVLLYAKLFAPQKYLDKTSNDYTNKKELNWTSSKRSDEYMPKDFIKPKSEKDTETNKIITDGQINVLNTKETVNGISFEVNSQNNSEVLLRIPYFPSWNLFVDGKKVSYKAGSTGLTFNLPSGKSLVSVKFMTTNIEMIANIISLCSFAALFLGIIYARKKRAL